MLCFDDGRYIAIAPDGRFDAEELEQLHGLNWVMSDDPLYPSPAEVFLRDYYEPRLLPRLLAGEPLPSVRPLTQLNRVQPVVTVSVIPSVGAADFVDAQLTVAATSRLIGETAPVEKNSGAYDVRLFRDGQLVSRWPEPAESDDAKPEPDPTNPKNMAAWQEANGVPLKDGKATQTFKVRLPREPGRKVKFTAYAFNKDRVNSATASAAYEVPGGVPPARPRAYVVAFGAEAFSDPDWDLRFSAADARLVLARLSTRLKGAGFEVIPLALVSPHGAPQAGEAPATKAHLRAVFARLSGTAVDPQAAAAIPGLDKLAAATPDDLVVVFTSSHGYTDARGAYYLVPADIGPPRPDTSYEVDQELLDHCISSGELSAWLRRIDAGQLALIVDACHAAATVDQPGFKPGPMGSRGLGQLAYDKGMRVLAASAADDVAIEAQALGHGLLTYALMREGIDQRRAAKDGRLTLGGLLAYGDARISSLYGEVRRQDPGLRRPARSGSARPDRRAGCRRQAIATVGSQRQSQTPRRDGATGGQHPAEAARVPAAHFVRLLERTGRHQPGRTKLSRHPPDTGPLTGSRLIDHCRGDIHESDPTLCRDPCDHPPRANPALGAGRRAARSKAPTAGSGRPHRADRPDRLHAGRPERPDGRGSCGDVRATRRSDATALGGGDRTTCKSVCRP